MPVVVIDTNVWVSAFINPRGAPARIREAFAKGEFQAVVSVPLLDEVAEVLARPRIRDKYGLDENEIAEFLRLLAQRSIAVITTGDLMFAETLMMTLCWRPLCLAELNTWSAATTISSAIKS